MKKILVIEDKFRILQRLKSLYARQIDAGQIVEAKSVREARNEIEKAVQISQPFDFISLDLGLPETSQPELMLSPDKEYLLDVYNQPEPIYKSEPGLELLRLIKKTGAAQSVTVYSAFRFDEDRRESVIQEIQESGFDFVPKYLREETQEKLLSQNLQQALQKVKEPYLRLLERRNRELAVYANQSVLYHLSLCFSRLSQAVRHETNLLRSELTEQFGLSLESDAPNSIAESLAALEDAVSTAKGEWQQLQAPFKLPEDSQRELVVETELRNLAKELRTCLNLKLDFPPEQATGILSFDDTLQDSALLVIREALVGGLSELTENEYTNNYEITVKVESSSGVAVISFHDNFKPLPIELAEAITNGENIPPCAGEWRAWGLSIVQHLALRGGGRLIVEPQEEGNLITYRVTLA